MNHPASSQPFSFLLTLRAAASLVFIASLLANFSSFKSPQPHLQPQLAAISSKINPSDKQWFIR